MNKGNKIALIARIFFYLFFAFLPFQIDALLVSSEIFYSGFFNPYLSHFVYLSDLFLLFGFLFYGFSMVFVSGKGKKKKQYGKSDRWIFWSVLSLIFMYGISLLFAVNHLNSLLYFLRFLELFGVYVVISRNLVNLRTLMLIFVSVIGFTALIGIFQYILQESLGLRFFGEPLISSQDLGVAKVTIFNDQLLRAYGFFPHPNIFAAYLVFALFFLIHFLREKWPLKMKVLFSALLFVCFFALVLTFSRSAFLGFFFALVFYLISSKFKLSFKFLGIFCVILSLLLLTFFVLDLYEPLLSRLLFNDSSAFSERFLYFVVSKEIFLDNFFGIGAGNFTDIMQAYSLVELTPWLFQPVHNVFLLLLNEIGVQGVLVYCFLFVSVFVFSVSKLRTKILAPLIGALWIFLLTVSLFDHYLISLVQGQVLLFMFFGMAGSLFMPE